MNILVVKLYPLSEIINALPTINLIKNHYQTRLTLVVHEFFSDLVDILEDVDNKILYPENELKSINRKNFRNSLHKYKYDLIIDLEGSMESALVCKKALRNPKAKIIGPSFQREGAFKLYDHIAGSSNMDRHPEEQCMDVLKFLNISNRDYKLKYKLDKLSKFTNINNFVLISIDSHHPKKFITYEMINNIIRLSSLKILIIGNQNALTNIEDIEEKYSEDKVQIIYKKLSLIEKIELLYKSSYCFCANYNDIQLLSSLRKKGCMINMNKKSLPNPTNKETRIVSQHNFHLSDKLNF